MYAAEKKKAFVLSQVRTKTLHFEHLYIWCSPGKTEKLESQGDISLNLRGKLYETEFLVLDDFNFETQRRRRNLHFLKSHKLPFLPLLVSILPNLNMFYVIFECPLIVSVFIFVITSMVTLYNFS